MRNVPAEQHCDPAKSVFRLIPPEKLVEITGKSVSAVYRTRLPREVGGKNGVFPHEDWKKIVEHAQANGIDIQFGDNFDEGARLRDVIAKMDTAEAAA